MALDRIADMSGDILKVRAPGLVAPNAFPVIPDPQEMRAILFTSNQGDPLGVSIDAVLDELGNGFERVALG
jgi:hypothetical protein